MKSSVKFGGSGNETITLEFKCETQKLMLKLSYCGLYTVLKKLSNGFYVASPAPPLAGRTALQKLRYSLV